MYICTVTVHLHSHAVYLHIFTQTDGGVFWVKMCKIEHFLHFTHFYTFSVVALRVPKNSPICIKFHPSRIRLGPFHLNLGSGGLVGIPRDNSKKLSPFLDAMHMNIGINPSCLENKAILV